MMLKNLEIQLAGLDSDQINEYLDKHHPDIYFSHFSFIYYRDGLYELKPQFEFRQFDKELKEKANEFRSQNIV